jgi:hypothetical protein
LSRTKLRIRSLIPLSSLAAGLLILANGAAQAQAAPATTAPTAASTSDSGASAQGQGDAHPGTPQSGAGKPASVCFKLTGHCVEGTKAGTTPATRNGSTAAKDASGSQKPLNLTAPDIRTVVSADELKEPLPSNEQISETDESATVSVKGDANAPDVPGGFGALWWALNHPSQAWRILTPAE